MGIFCMNFKDEYEHQIIVTHGSCLWSAFLLLLGVPSVTGPLGKEREGSLCHMYWYVVKRLTSNPYSVVGISTAQFQRNHYLDSVFLSSGQLCKPMTLLVIKECYSNKAMKSDVWFMTHSSFHSPNFYPLLKGSHSLWWVMGGESEKWLWYSLRWGQRNQENGP